MASLYKKVMSGKPYWYLREIGFVDGEAEAVSERYLGTAADIEALLDAREAAVLPERTRHLAFGDVAAAWGMLAGAGSRRDYRRGGRGAPCGRGCISGHLPGAGGAEPAGRPVFQGGVRGLVEDHRRRPVHRDTPASVLDHRRFWDAMHAVTVEQLEEISRKIAVRIVECSGADCSSVALDMTNFATFIDSGNDKAPIAQRGKAKQKRADLRLVGLGLVVTRDGGIRC